MEGVNLEGMTLDQIRAKLDEMGVPHDKWGGAGGKTVQPLRIDKYKALLIQIRTLLEDQVEKDKEKISDLHTMVQRAKHGGGL